MKRMEFSDSGTADGGVELSLGLSIGGSSRRAMNTGPVRHGAATLLGSGEGLPFDGGDHLRRREAKKNGFLGGGNGVPVDDRAAQEVQALELRARNREAREREAFAADRRGRESDGRIGGIARIPCPHPNNQNPVAYGSHPFAAMAMQYPYHRVQYLPIPNGLGFSFVMPCWAPAVSRVASNGSTDAEMNVLQQVARRISPVSVPAVSADGGISGARYLDMKGGNGIGVNGAPLSINSPRSCSSGLSDHKSGSLPGSCISTDTRSHSTHTMAEKPGSQPSSQVSNSQRHAAPLPKGSDEGTEKIITSTAGSSLVLNSATSAMGKLDRATSVNKPISSAEDQNPNGSSSLPRMPYVSTTGNGPNGRTITGFLYTYTKSEVSIICVCHGSSFSPEEFVRHAGGTNIAHPLRQIVVVP